MIDTITLPMPTLSGTVNAHLVLGAEGVSLIDCGIRDPASLEQLDRGLRDKGHCFSDIETVFLTHSHVDHAGAARFLQRQGAKIVMSSVEARLMADFYRSSEQDKTDAVLSGRHGLPPSFARSVKSVFTFLGRMGEDFTPDAVVEDGDTLLLSGLPFEAVATPGHTPGHLCPVSRELKIAFTGDCVISPRAAHISASSIAAGADPYLDFIKSLERLAAFTDVTPLSGHGAHQKPLHISAPKIIAYLKKELSSVLERLSDTPMSAFDLTRTGPGARSRAFPKWLAVSQTLAYLSHLVFQGKARCIETEAETLYARRV